MQFCDVKIYVLYSWKQAISHYLAFLLSVSVTRTAPAMRNGSSPILSNFLHCISLTHNTHTFCLRIKLLRRFFLSIPYTYYNISLGNIYNLVWRYITQIPHSLWVLSLSVWWWLDSLAAGWYITLSSSGSSFTLIGCCWDPRTTRIDPCSDPLTTQWSSVLSFLIRGSG